MREVENEGEKEGASDGGEDKGGKEGRKRYLRTENSQEYKLKNNKEK